jgi:hypothetical protein
MSMPAAVVKAGLATIVGSTLAACEPRTESLSGVVSLEYAGASAAGVAFVLKNGSSEKVSFRGEYRQNMIADPWDTRVDCRATNGTTRYEHPVEVGADKPEIIQLSPREKIRLLIWTDFMAERRGARCRLRLELEDHTIVESGEFVP